MRCRLDRVLRGILLASAIIAVLGELNAQQRATVPDDPAEQASRKAIGEAVLKIASGTADAPASRPAGTAPPREVGAARKPDPKTPLPPGPVAAGKQPVEITLVPYGCTKFRISMFPITGRAFAAPELTKSRAPAGK
jgi:hypothetical protein